MKRLEDRIYKRLRTQDVVEIATKPAWNLDKAHAIYELATRALRDEQLLSTTLTVIANEIAFVPRRGPALASCGASLLYDRRTRPVNRALAESIPTWTFDQEECFFLLAVPRQERLAFFEHLVLTYNFPARIDIDTSGDIIFQA